MTRKEIFRLQCKAELHRRNRKTIKIEESYSTSRNYDYDHVIIPGYDTITCPACSGYGKFIIDLPMGHDYRLGRNELIYRREIKECDHCGGSGSIDEEDSMFGSVRTCPWCKGTGQVNVIDLDSYLVTQIIELGELLSKARKEMNY
jgi:DnaJ-class molecular chaperone